MRKQAPRSASAVAANSAQMNGHGPVSGQPDNLIAHKCDNLEQASITPEAIERLARLIASTSKGQVARDSIAASQLLMLGNDFRLDCEMRAHSPRTREIRAIAIKLLDWFLQHHRRETCGQREIKDFFHYLQSAHDVDQGRYGLCDGSAGSARYGRALSPHTVYTYWNHLSTFFTWLVREGIMDVSPFHGLTSPVCPKDQISPFSQDEVRAILAAAKQGRNAPRDTAIVLFLLDTGVRSTELCRLKRSDLDLRQHHAEVMGKGRKKRKVCLGLNLTRAIYQYLATHVVEGDGPLFAADKNGCAGQPLTRSGMGQIIRRLCRAAGVTGPRCSPHRFRHTFAVEFLRAGGNAFTLKELLGHTSLNITMRYVAFAEADIEAQHRLYSPGDRLKRV